MVKNFDNHIVGALFALTLMLAAPIRAGEAAAPARQAGQLTWTNQPAAPAAAVVSQPAPAGNFEGQPISFPGDDRRQRQNSGQPRGSTLSLPSLLPLLFFVLMACGMFIGILYLVKKYLPGHRQLFSHPAMEVLGRTHLDQRRFISLVRVGKRILVVGVSPDEIHSLSEITDEEEITGILEVARPKTDAGLTLFQRLFQHHVVDNEKAETRAMAQVKAEELAEQMSALRERVRSIRASEEPARQVDALG